MGKSMVVFALFLSFGLQADMIIPSAIRQIGVCVKIANLNEFPIVVVLAAPSPVYGRISGALFKPDSCKGGISWGYSAKLFWADKTFYDSVGMKGILNSKTVKNAFSGIGDKKSFKDSPVHLLCDTIRFIHSAVPDSSRLLSEDRIHTIVKSGSSYGLYLSERISHLKKNVISDEKFHVPVTR